MPHGYMKFVSLLEVIAGLLLLVGRYVPLGLVILGPIFANKFMPSTSSSGSVARSRSAKLSRWGLAICWSYVEALKPESDRHCSSA